jgi:hypothetical protein
VESLGHAWHTEGGRRALTGYPSWSPTREAASAPIRRRKAQSHRRGDPQADGSRVHQRGIPSRMACQPCACEKERREMADVCRLHWSEQSMSESSLSSASHRSYHGFHCWVRNPVSPRCLLRVSPNQDERVRPARDFFHHTFRHVLLRYQLATSFITPSSRKQAIKQYINSGLPIIVCHFLTSLLYVTLEILFDNFWCIKY